MLNNSTWLISMQKVQCMLLFLVRAVTSDRFQIFTEVHAQSYSSCPALFLHSHYMCFLNQVTSRHVSAFLVNLHTRIPYIGKLLREKTFTNWWIAQVLANYGYGHRLIITSHTYVLSMIQPLAVTVVGHVLPIKFS